MNFRQSLYFSLVALGGQQLGRYYRSILDEDKDGIPRDTTENRLIKMLAHCGKSVPYYAKIMERIDRSFSEDPVHFLEVFPVLTKKIIRQRFNDLKSSDLSHRRWHISTTGGSTGEPFPFIQDKNYAACSGAITLLFSKLAGREIGEPQVSLWGSVHDIAKTKMSWRARLMGGLSHSMTLNAFRMSPEQMSQYLRFLNRKKPKLIVAYADAMHALAQHAEREKINVVPQKAIIVSAQTLHPPMREIIERVFQCRVYNRYGSRELGDIACERPGIVGLWVAPWGNYVEIVDDQDRRVPDGQEGRILVTSLTNFAMPLIRYSIDDRGFLLPADENGQGKFGQILGGISGRAVDSFRKKDGTIIHAGYFHYLLYYREWIQKFQVIQKDYGHVVYKFVRSNSHFDPSQLEEIRAKTKIVMGADCLVEFELVNEIHEGDSGKHRHLICEIPS